MHLIGNRERPDFTEPENSQEKARLWISKICPDFEIQRARAGILPPSDIRNNSHWGIGSDKVWQDAPGKVQLRDKDTPRSPGRRPESPPGARLMMQSTWVVSGRSTRNPALELSLIWSVCSRLVLCSCWCCDNVSFFSYFFREDLPCWFNCWVHFRFRHRWRFFDSKKKGASAWQNSPINRKAKYCSQAGNPAYWTNLNWTDVLTSTFLNVEGFWPPLKLAIMLRTHEILQQFCLTEI